MGAAPVVEADISGDPCARFGHAVVGAEVALLVLDTSPEPLDEDVVAPRAFAVHADLDLPGCQNLDEVGGCELTALIAVEDLWLAMASQGFFQCLDAEACIARDRYPPCQDAACGPVDHRREIDEAPRHGNIGDVHRPDVVRARDGEVPQQVWVDLVARRRFRGVGLAIQRFDAHALHQRGDVKTPHHDPFLDQQSLQHAATRERELHM